MSVLWGFVLKSPISSISCTVPHAPTHLTFLVTMSNGAVILIAFTCISSD